MCDITETRAYLRTVAFAMDCLGHSEDTWAAFLKQRGDDFRENRAYHKFDCIDKLCDWRRTAEGPDFWLLLYYIDKVIDPIPDHYSTI